MNHNKQDTQTFKWLIQKKKKKAENLSNELTLEVQEDPIKTAVAFEFKSTSNSKQKGFQGGEEVRGDRPLPQKKPPSASHRVPPTFPKP